MAIDPEAIPGEEDVLGSDWMPVYGSSHVQQIKYDQARRDAYIMFDSGAVYVYHGVTMEQWQGLVHSSSKGSYVERVLRRIHSYARVS